MGISTVKDLLYHFPFRYGDTAEFVNISRLNKGAMATVFAKFQNSKLRKLFAKKFPWAKEFSRMIRGK